MALVKFPLIMANKFKCYRLEQLKEHFDIGSVVNYFHTRQLIRWLRANRYAEKLAAVEKLSANDRNLAQKLGAIFGFEIPSDTPDDGGDIARLLKYLKQFTDDKKLLAQIEQELSEGTAFVARNQAELDGEETQYFDKVYLVQGEFVIPLEKTVKFTDKTYIGIGDKVITSIRNKEPVDFNKLNIKFKGVQFVNDTPSKVPKTFPQINWDNPEEFISPRDLSAYFELYKPADKTTEKQLAFKALTTVAKKLKKVREELLSKDSQELACLLYKYLIKVEDHNMSTKIDKQIDINSSALKAVIDVYESQAQILKSMKSVYYYEQGMDMCTTGKIVANQVIELFWRDNLSY